MQERKTLDIIAEEIAKLLLPLDSATSDSTNFEAFLNELGWELPAGCQDLGFSNIGISDMIKNLDIVINSTAEEENDAGLMVLRYANLLDSIINLFEDINNTSISISKLPGLTQEYIQKTDIINKLFIRLLDLLVIKYFEKYHYRWYSAFILLGIFKITPEQEDLNIYQTRYISRKINYDYFPLLFKDPSSLFQKEYGWSKSFDSRTFLLNLAAFLESFGGSVWLKNLSAAAEEQILGSPVSVADFDPMPQIDVSIIQSLAPWETLDVGMKAYGLRPTSDGGGVGITPFVRGSVDLSFPLMSKFFLDIDTNLDLQGDIVLIVRPDKLEVRSGLLGSGQGASITSGKFLFTLRFGDDDADPVRLLSIPGGSCLQFQKIYFSLGIDTNEKQTQSLIIEIGFKKGTLILTAGEGDGFIQKILPKAPLEFDFDLLMGFSKQKGFYIKGGAGFEYTFQINKTLGPITVTTLDLRLGTKEETISLITAISANAEIGPVSASVEKIGLETMLDFSKKGALGNADIGFGFKPPTGVGLSIDASVIKGGGYLSINDGNYAGILQLEIANKVSITAIGILTTRMPDGTKIFSLKFFGMVEFPPVQLGFGIFLNGVGLAVAIHCSMNAEALKKSVYTGSLSSLLFPPDPIKNAVKIISDLQSFFPPEEGCYAFGVMAKLGWGGVKALVQAEVGVFIELANGKFRKIALAGIAKCILPTDDNQILHIEFQVIGIIDFSNDTFSIDASLEKSFILIFNLDGDIALRACWGDNPRFALSMGGFYPGFVAPNNFPQLRRMSISLGSDNPRIGLLSYMAITENSVQIGAALLFHYEKKTGVGYFEVDGGMGFDALFEFNPFYFETKMYAYLALKRNHEDLFNVRLDLTLSGPNNWHAVGYAKFEVLCVDVTVSFDETFGEKRPEIPPPVVSPLEALTSELIDRHNWSVLPPKYGAGKVTFRKNAENEPYVDPFGEICFRQKSIPFGINIEKYGNSDINPDECYFEIKPDITNIGSSNAPAMKDEFSPGTYKKLTDQEKISAKAFEQMNSGFKISVDKVELGSNKENNVIVYGKDLCYNTISPNSGEKPTHGGFVMPQSLINSQFITGQKYYNKFNAKSPSAMDNRIVVKEQKFAVISSKAIDGKFKIDNVKADISYAKAAQLKKNKVSTNFHIVCASKAVIV